MPQRAGPADCRRSSRPALLVTADDLGYSAVRDEGIFRCSWRAGGLVTRASLLVNGASAVTISGQSGQADTETLKVQAEKIRAAL